jgi:hypothetical protein
MTGFRPMTAEELAAPSMFDEILHPPPGRFRWHCTRCGRFVPSAGVRRLAPIPGEADDRDFQGDCKTHGRVDVVWGQS